MRQGKVINPRTKTRWYENEHSLEDRASEMKMMEQKNQDRKLEDELEEISTTTIEKNQREIENFIQHSYNSEYRKGGENRRVGDYPKK